MQYRYDGGYRCWVAYRSIGEIKNLEQYSRDNTRAVFVLENDAAWYCRAFNDAVAQKVEPFE